MESIDEVKEKDGAKEKKAKVEKKKSKTEEQSNDAAAVEDNNGPLKNPTDKSDSNE